MRQLGAGIFDRWRDRTRALGLRDIDAGQSDALRAPNLPWNRGKPARRLDGAYAQRLAACFNSLAAAGLDSSRRRALDKAYTRD